MVSLKMVKVSLTGNQSLEIDCSLMTRGRWEETVLEGLEEAPSGRGELRVPI
jgi:hypothetical protein